MPHSVYSILGNCPFNCGAKFKFRLKSDSTLNEDSVATKKSQDEWRTLSVEERIRYGVQAINGVQGDPSPRRLGWVDS